MNNKNVFRGTVSLKSVRLSENKLKNISYLTFKSMSSETITIELWENEISCDCHMSNFKKWVEEVLNLFYKCLVNDNKILNLFVIVNMLLLELYYKLLVTLQYVFENTFKIL